MFFIILKFFSIYHPSLHSHHDYVHLVVIFLNFFLLKPNFNNVVHCWNNGLALTPPMGWMDWTIVKCNVDCEHHPHLCVNQQLYREAIDLLVSEGYYELGYNTVNIDDCWLARRRDPKTHQLLPNNTRFPNGIPSLVKYANSKGLQLGIYEDIGTATCAGYPGTRSNGNDWTMLDAKTFTEWGVGSLKMDGCFFVQNPNEMQKAYTQYSYALQQHGSSIVFACSWPAYLKENESDYEQIRRVCNYWRNYGDIDFSWTIVDNIIKHYGKYCHKYSKYHGPGGWFDPDMLIIGSKKLTLEQSKTQMAFWCLWSAPLLMSNDLVNIATELKQILQNRHLIELDQDPLGKMGVLVGNISNIKNTEVWVKELSKQQSLNRSSFSNNDNNIFSSLSSTITPWIVLYYNRDKHNVHILSHKLSNLIPTLKSGIKYNVHDLYQDGKVIDSLNSDDYLKLKVLNDGAVRIVKLVADEKDKEEVFDGDVD